MSFYRTLLAAVAAVVIATPVFADDATNAQQSPSDATPAVQSSDGTDAQATSADQQGTATTAPKININTASTKELAKVKGITTSKAKAIVAYRKKHGGFKSLDDLAKVKGFTKMKPDTMQNIQDQLTVD